VMRREHGIDDCSCFTWGLKRVEFCDLTVMNQGELYD
jgi:hypothetical protein